jgi:SAM-dependent methyltransferase
MAETGDKRIFSPSTARNRGPILDVLRRVLPATGTVLEIASGTGEHAAHFAAHFPHLAWQPTDRDPEALASIAGWIEATRLANIRPPILLDVGEESWPLSRADAIVCINMIHISPWAATEQLMRGAGRLLPADGVLFLYGPYRRADHPTAPSNEAFDADLRRRNPEWGLRTLEAVTELASKHRLSHVETVDMPANNLSVIFRRSSPNGIAPTL